MPTLPPALLHLLAPFAPCFSRRVWPHALVLVVGAILAPGRRTVAAALRAMGLAHDTGFGRYHRVLSRARWSGLAVGRALLGLLVAAFAPGGPLLVGIDETVERRRGAKIAAKGIYRDAVRSSRSHFVKASGLRWVCLMLLVPVPWAGRSWALPFLTALAPSERYDREHGRRHKSLTDWTGQLLLAVRRWWPDRPVVAVADATYAALEFLAGCHRAAPTPITVVTRLRLDAALYEPAPPRRPRQTGRPRLKGRRLPTLAATAADPGTAWAPVTVANWYGRGDRDVEVATGTAVWYHSGLPPVPLRWVLVRDPAGAFGPQALLCTDLAAGPEQVLGWFVQRWQLEVTFEEARRHLGLETQRQWSDLAIGRTTPALLGLFSVVTLLAHPHMAAAGRARRAAWYPKPRPTFADALASIRRRLWEPEAFRTSPRAGDIVEVPRAVMERLTDALCYAA
ncbi:MAG: transposase [Chloroflexota bacterium]|nr:transposase [Chloroflexota bacterium]